MRTAIDLAALGIVALLLASAGCAAQARVGSGAASRGAGATASAKQDHPDGERTACDAPSDCELVTRDPCHCGTTTAREVDALNAEWSRAHPVEPGRSCPDCLSEPNPGLRATCRRGHCAVLDVPASPLSRCDTAADCVATDPACCPPCGPYWHMVAVNRMRVGALRTAVCGGGSTITCPACASPPAPTPPVGCVAGHCRITSDGD